MAENCLFCKIVGAASDADVVYSDAAAIVINDLNPQAPTHLLVIPRRHFANIAEIGSDADAAAGWVAAIGAVAAVRGLSDYRTVTNTGAAAGQSVFHLHAHLLAGRTFGWPPG